MMPKMMNVTKITIRILTWGTFYSDPKRQKVSSFNLENPFSCAPYSCIIEKSVDDGANNLPIYTNPATSSTNLVSYQRKPCYSLVENLVGDGIPERVVAQESLFKRY